VTRLSLLRSSIVGLVALRANPVRSALAALGVIIGVGALLSILAIGDGAEVMARHQIATTTDLHTIMVQSVTTESLDGLRVDRPVVRMLTVAEARELATRVQGTARVTLSRSQSARLVATGGGPPKGATLIETLASGAAHFDATVVGGTFFSRADVDSAHPVIVLSRTLADDLFEGRTAEGASVTITEREYQVIGVIADRAEAAAGTAFIPLARGGRPPVLLVKALRVEDIDAIRAQIVQWLADKDRDWARDFVVRSNVRRVAQTKQAFAVMKLVIGTIAGLSLLVGGIGIMNVLLASVSERTREIGVRRAVGARRRDILVQFLAESVALTTAGSLLGTILGIGVAMVAAAVISRITGAPLAAAFTLPTFVIALLMAFAVGVLFGTYPARRASHLSPVDAIRHD